MADEPLRSQSIPPIPAAGDYDAVCAALRQTAQGRWFLEECTRRSQNGHAAAAHADSSDETTRRVPVVNPPTDVFALAERLQDLAWAMRDRALDQGTCEQIEALARVILSASSLRDPIRLQKLSQALEHLEERVRKMIVAAGDAERSDPGKLASEAQPDDLLLEPRPISSLTNETAQSLADARSTSRVVDMDEELFAVSSNGSPKPAEAARASSAPPRPVSRTRSDPLAALNAMSDEEKIALFT